MGRWPLLACSDGNLVGPRWCVLGLAVSCRAGVVRPRHRAPDFQQGQNTKPPAHQILVMRPHLAGPDDRRVDQAPDLYILRISGHLGPTALSAFSVHGRTAQGTRYIAHGS